MPSLMEISKFSQQELFEFLFHDMKLCMITVLGKINGFYVGRPNNKICGNPSSQRRILFQSKFTLSRPGNSAPLA